jgi:O-antigen/teichoic acid export membrane protein
VGEQKSLKKNMFMSMILTASNFVFPLLTFSYVSRVLTPAGTGKVAFASSCLAYFSYIAVLGISTYGPRECAKVRDDKTKLSNLAQELLTINLISTGVAYFLFLIVLIAVPKIWQERQLFIVMSSSLLLKTIGMEWLFQALEEYTYITKRSLIFKVISVVLTFALIRDTDDYVRYGFLTIFTTSASYISNFIYARKYISFKKSIKFQLKRHLKPLFVLLSASIFVTIYANFDVVMLGFIKSDYEVGLYNAALKIKTIVLSVSTSLADVLIPRISYYFSKGEMKKIKELVIKSCRVSLLLAAPLAIYIMIFSNEVIWFACGKEYIAANNTLRILILCVFLMFFTYVFGQQILIPLGREKIYTQSVFTGMFINLLLNLLLIPYCGAVGAAIGTLITEMWNLIYMGYGVKKIGLNILKNIHFTKYVIGLLLAGIVGCFVGAKMRQDNIFLFLLITSVVFFGVYYLFLSLNREPLIYDEIEKLKGKIGHHEREN